MYFFFLISVTTEHTLCINQLFTLNDTVSGFFSLTMTYDCVKYLDGVRGFILNEELIF